MSIPVTCPNGHKMKVKDRFSGKIGLCPVCRAAIHVPSAASLRLPPIRRRRQMSG